MKSVMSLSPPSKPAHSAPAEDAHFYRKPILTATSRVVTEAPCLQEASAKGGDKYPATGIISYAQNGEDILLWRALRDLPNGFYIDVGAEDPTQNSVTRAFYERGWHGINVEPVLAHCDKLCNERPRDLTLQVAIGDRVGWSTLSSRIPDCRRLWRRSLPDIDPKDFAMSNGVFRL